MKINQKLKHEFFDDMCNRVSTLIWDYIIVKEKTKNESKVVEEYIDSFSQFIKDFDNNDLTVSQIANFYLCCGAIGYRLKRMLLK